MIILQAIGLALLTVLGIAIIATVFIKLMIFAQDNFGDTGEIIALISVAVLMFTIVWILQLS